MTRIEYELDIPKLCHERMADRQGKKMCMGEIPRESACEKERLSIIITSEFYNHKMIQLQQIKYKTFGK